MLEIGAAILAGIVIIFGLTIFAAIAIVFISSLEPEDYLDD